MKPIKTSVSITLDDPILNRVKQLAEQEDRSLSSYINLVLKARRRWTRKMAPDAQRSLKFRPCPLTRRKICHTIRLTA